MNKAELKPCPFCGSAVSIEHLTKGWPYDVPEICPNGGWSIRHEFDSGGCIGRNVNYQWFKSEQEAIAAWNRRYGEPRTKEG